MSSIRSEKMQQALHSVVERVTRKAAGSLEKSFDHNNQQHALTCAEECVFATAQHLRKCVTAVLEEVRTENEYYLEKAALLLFDLSSANESLARVTAELQQSYDDPHVTYTLFPHLEAMITEAQKRYSALDDIGTTGTEDE